jgi:hypothetical protein
MHNDTKNSCFLIDIVRGMLYTNGFRNVLSLRLGSFDLVRFEVLSRCFLQRIETFYLVGMGLSSPKAATIREFTNSWVLWLAASV